MLALRSVARSEERPRSDHESRKFPIVPVAAHPASCTDVLRPKLEARLGELAAVANGGTLFSADCELSVSSENR